MVGSFGLLAFPALILLILAGQPSAAMPLTYPLSPAASDILFDVDVLGFATTRGQFKRFSGRLTVDFDHPEQSAVSVSVETGSAAVGWEPGDSLLVGESYLDAQHYPIMLFESEEVTPLAEHRVRLNGMLTLHGVKRWESFEADLVDRHWNGDHTREEGDFTATGVIHRSHYNIAADQVFLDDKVTFIIHARLVLTDLRLKPAPIP